MKYRKFTTIANHKSDSAELLRVKQIARNLTWDVIAIHFPRNRDIADACGVSPTAPHGWRKTELPSYARLLIAYHICATAEPESSPLPNDREMMAIDAIATGDAMRVITQRIDRIERNMVAANDGRLVN